jgi:hypothetical protein
MSLYSFVEFGAAAAIPAAGLADVVGGAMSVRVEEEQMDLILSFKGTVLATGPGDVQVGFAVGGVALAKLGGAHALVLGEYHLNVEQRITLTKGDHLVTLQMNDVATICTIDGGPHECRFGAERLSSAATLAHGVDSKVQGIF